MLILRIRQAEVATGAGRLDEAFELATRDGRFRSHRRGQDAITRIIEALVRRGREHLAAGRMAQAAADCEKAGRLGGDLPDVVQLRIELAAAHRAQQRQQREAGLALAAARRHVADGALSLGRGMLTDLNDTRARRLMNEIDDHRARLEVALATARAAIERRDWPAAVGAIVGAREIRSTDAQVLELVQTVSRELSQQTSEAIHAGRLDRAAETLGFLRRTDGDSASWRDADRALGFCHLAWLRLKQGNTHEAREFLERFAVLFPRVPWMEDLLEQVRTIDKAMSSVRTGPLALVAEMRDEPQLAAKAEPAKDTPRNQIPPGPGPMHAGTLPERFILQVDGAGAFLVVRSAAVKVGPISSSALPDVPLIADATAPAVTIERVEEDYFLRSPSPVALNEKPASEALLGSGDRVALSPRCRFTFALPHPASTSAVLDLAGARHPRGDVRRVILLDRDLVLGGSAASHVRVPGLAAQLVLNLHGGLLRASAPATANARVISREEGLPVGVAIEAGGVRFVISPV